MSVLHVRHVKAQLESRFRSRLDLSDLAARAPAVRPGATGRKGLRDGAHHRRNGVQYMNKRMQRKSEWKRFRIDPPAIIVGADGTERVLDVVWLETMKDGIGRNLSAIGAPYVMRINFDQVRETLSNPTNGAMTGQDAEAILMLKVQVVFTMQVP